MEFPTRTGMVRSPIHIDDSACDPDDLAQCGGVSVTVPGDQPWDELVALAVDSDWTGVEWLSGVPGDVASAVRGNTAAYGQSVSDTVASVRTWDRLNDAQRTFAWADCQFGDGTSRFQEQLPDGQERYEVLDVIFLFRQGDLTPPLSDDLAAALGAPSGSRVPLSQVRHHLV